MTTRRQSSNQVDLFGKLLREKLFAKNSPLEKSYLSILINEIVVKDKAATIRGRW